MDSPDRRSVSLLLADLKAGDVEALEPLWERYFRRLIGLARHRLGQSAHGLADGEDVALDAMDSLCRGALAGRFPRLDDRDDLWRLLACLAARKASALRRDEGRLKRGGGGVRVGDRDELEGVLDEAPSPELVALLADESQRLLAKLEDEALRQLAAWKLQGFTNEEIADRLGCVPRTVERKLARIRAAWTDAT